MSCFYFKLDCPRCNEGITDLHAKIQFKYFLDLYLLQVRQIKINLIFDPNEV